MRGAAESVFEHQVGELLVVVAIGREQFEGSVDERSADRIDLDAA